LRVYKHLRRLESVWIEPPLYFLTICVAGRRPILANDQAFDILRGEFGAARERYGWTVGRFVVMPDHLHFFCMSDDLPDSSSLSRFIGGFKQWSAKRIVHAKGVSPPLWQEQFSIASCAQTKATNRNGSMFGTTRSEPGSSMLPRIGRTAARSRRLRVSVVAALAERGPTRLVTAL